MRKAQVLRRPHARRFSVARRVVVGAIAAVVVAGCSSDGDHERLQTALAEGLSDHMMVEEDEARCLAERTIVSLGPSALETEGFGPDASFDRRSLDRLLALDKTAIGLCVNLEERLAAATVELGAVWADDCVDGDVLGRWPLARDLIDRALAEGELETRSKLQLRRAAGHCLEDLDFSRLVGLPSSDDWKRVLIADPFAASSRPDDQDLCVTSVVVDTLGAARLDELRLRLDDPDWMSVRARLATDEVDAIVSGLDRCDLYAQVHRYVVRQEGAIADCLLDDLGYSERTALARSLVAGERVTSVAEDHPVVAERCADREIRELFGDPPRGSLAVEQMIINLTTDFDSGANLFEKACVPVALRTITSEADAVNAVEVLSAGVAGDEPDVEKVVAYDEFMYRAVDASNRCVRP